MQKQRSALVCFAPGDSVNSTQQQGHSTSPAKPFWGLLEDSSSWVGGTEVWEGGQSTEGNTNRSFEL